MKKALIKEFILQDNKFDLLADSDINASDSAEIVGGVSSEEVVRTDSLPQNLFIFGDSMTFNLALRLAQYARQNGHVIHSVNWDSSNTKYGLSMTRSDIISTNTVRHRFSYHWEVMKCTSGIRRHVRRM